MCRGQSSTYKEAIRLDPKDALAHYNLGIALKVYTFRDVTHDLASQHEMRAEAP